MPLSPQMLVTVPLVLGGLCFICIFFIIGVFRGSLDRQMRFVIAFFLYSAYGLFVGAAAEYDPLRNYSVFRHLGFGVYTVFLCHYGWISWKGRKDIPRRK